MNFLNEAKAFAKKLDTDKLAEEISSVSHTAATMGAKAGLFDQGTAAKLDSEGKSLGHQLDVFGDKHPEYFGNKPQQAPNPSVPSQHGGLQSDVSAPHGAGGGYAPDSAPQAFVNQQGAGHLPGPAQGGGGGYGGGYTPQHGSGDGGTGSYGGQQGGGHASQQGGGGGGGGYAPQHGSGSAGTGYGEQLGGGGSGYAPQHGSGGGGGGEYGEQDGQGGGGGGGYAPQQGGRQEY